jgi:membrane-bound serine protease (ClpP class)
MLTLLRRPRFLLGLLLVLVGIAAACASSSREPDQVHVLTWDGDVNPVMERYINRGIDTAEKSQARAVVLRLDTPGGLDSAMRDIVQRIGASEVPVIVYVAPAGSRAASAGTFITMAGHIAAMAPNTTIGAATPINSDGQDIEGALGRKVLNDAVAYIRSIAELRGRNADWAERAVRDAVVATETEAAADGIVDFVADSLDDLLAQADGRQVNVTTSEGGTTTWTLRTANAPITENDPNLFETLLNQIANPNVAFLLLSLGGLAIVSEIFHPTIFAGVFGVIALVLAYFSLGSLPTNWAGVALIAFGFVLITAEIFVAGFGVLGIGGVISLILGGLILTSSNETGLQVSRWLIFSMAAAIGAFLILFIGTIVRLRRMPSVTGKQSLIGAKGITRSRIDPRGTVWVAGEMWDATAEDGPIEDETPIIVTSATGLRLQVKRDPAFIKLLPPAPALEGSREGS